MAERKSVGSDRAGRPRDAVAGSAARWRGERSGSGSGRRSRGALTSEDAAVEAGVSPAVGGRWFRESGGMPTVSQAPLSGRYLSFAEREEIALLRAQGRGVREIARRLRPLAVDDLAGAAPQRRDARRRRWSIGRRPRSGTPTGGPGARRPRSSPPTSRCASYVQDRLSGAVTRPDGSAVAGPEVRWIGRRHGRRQDRRWATSWSPEQIANRLRARLPR